MTRIPAIARPAALAAAALLAAPVVAESADGPAPVVAQMHLADGKDVGTVTFTQTGHGVVVAVKVHDLTPGRHGLHIHTVGACTPDFQAAGGHFNPANTEHGFHAAGGYHAGDLPNLDVAANGSAEAEFFVPALTIHGPASAALPFVLHDADGAAIMIHAGTDDYATMASSGGRLACGVIIPKG